MEEVKYDHSGPQFKKALEIAPFMGEFFCLLLLLFLSARMHPESDWEMDQAMRILRSSL